MAFEAGTIYVNVVPDFGGFHTKVRAVYENVAKTASRTVTESLSKKISRNFDRASRGLHKQSEQAFKQVQAVAEKTASLTQKAVDGTVTRVKTMGAKMSAAVRPVLDPLVGQAKRVMSGVAGVVATRAPGIKKALHSITENPGFERLRGKAMVAAAGVALTFDGLALRAKQTFSHMGDSFGAGFEKVKATAASVGSRIAPYFTRAFDTVGRAAQGAARAAKTALSGIGALAAAAGSALAGMFAASVGSAVDRVDTLNNFPIVMKNLGYSSAEAKGAVDKLDKGLQGLPTALNDMIPLVQQLAPLSDSLEDATNTGLAFNNMVLASGKGMADQTRATQQFTQMLSTGTVDMMSWRTLMEVMPGQMNQLAQAMLGAGHNGFDLYDAIQDGTVSLDDMNDAIVRLNKEGSGQFASFEEQARSATGGIKTVWQNFKTAITRNTAEIIEAIGVDRITGAINKVKDLVSGGIGAVTSLFKNAGTPEGGNKLAGVLAGVGAALGPLSKLFGGALSKLPMIGGLVSKFLPSISGPVGIVIGLITSMISKSQKLRDAFGTAFKTIVDAFKKVVGDGKGVEAFMGSIGKLLGKLGDLLAPVVELLGVVAGKLITVLGAAIKWVADKLTAFIDWATSDAGPALQGFWDAFANSQAVQTIQAIAGEIVTALQPVFETLRHILVDVLGPAVVWLWQNVMVPAWGAIQMVVTNAVTVIKGILQVLWAFIQNVLAPVFVVLWQAVIVPVWDGIKAAITVACAVIRGVLDALVWVVKNVLGPVWTWLKDSVIVPVWNGIKTTVTNVTNFFNNTIVPKIKSFTDRVGGFFTHMSQVAKNAWNSLKAGAAKPVNFVINTVYNDGLRKGFNSLASKVGLSSVSLPEMKPVGGYARGGVLPGYTPGRDVYRFYSPQAGLTLDLSGGEGIIRPDALRALGGRKWLERVNRTRGRGITGRGDYGTHRAYAKGGVLDRFRDWGANKIKTAFATAKDFVSDVLDHPIKKLKELLFAPARNLLTHVGGGTLGQIVAGVPPLYFQGIGNWFKKKTSAIGGGGSRLARQARKYLGVPYVWGGSSIPPGLDCSGLVYYAYNAMGKHVPRLTAAGYQAASRPIPRAQMKSGDLLFWGFPAHHVAIASGRGRMIEEPRPGLSAREVPIYGNPTVGRYFDNGGVLPPGLSAAINMTRKPELVLTNGQWETMSGTLTELLKGRGLPDEVNLVVDDRASFRAHVEGIADSRIIEGQRIVRSKR